MGRRSGEGFYMLTAKFRFSSKPGLSASLRDLLQSESLDEFAARTEHLLRGALPFHSLCISFNSLEYFSPALVRDTQLSPSRDPTYMTERYSAFDPTPHFLRQHLGVARSTLNEHLHALPPSIKTPYCERFQRREGWDKYVEIYFWEGRRLKALVCVRRAAAQPDFNAHELRLLDHLRFALAGVIGRLHRQQCERTMTHSLRDVLQKLPVPLVMLDWSLQPFCFNFEARRLCVDWLHGEVEARAVKGAFVPAVPPEILVACEARRHAALSSGFAPQFVHVAHARRPELSAQVELFENVGSAVGAPYFLIRLHRKSSPERNAGDEHALPWLAQLTRCERAVALLVRDGQTNAAIGSLLRKSESTVKMQLCSAFRKLGVRNRTQLAAQLR